MRRFSIRTINASAQGKVSFGVGQISSLNEKELDELKQRILPYLRSVQKEQGIDMAFFMLTNILTESTMLLYEGQGAKQLILRAFRIDEKTIESGEDGMIRLPGVVSRKKQLIPAVVTSLSS